MGSIYDNESIALKCENPDCDAEFFRSVGELQLDPDVTCPKCQAVTSVVDLESRLADAVSKRLDRSIGVNLPTDTSTRPVGS